jgi:hypothetical protein
MSERPISRRRFLAVAGGLAAPLALAPLRPWTALIEVETVPSAVRLASLLADRESAAVVGRAYLRTVREQPDAASLAELVTSSLPRGPHALAAGDEELRRLLAQRVERDFADERIATVDGWVFSLTEARLCGLCALVS